MRQVRSILLVLGVLLMALLAVSGSALAKPSSPQRVVLREPYMFYLAGVGGDTAVVDTWTPTVAGSMRTTTTVAAFSISSGQRTEIHTGHAEAGGGSTSGNMVVWWDARNSIQNQGPIWGWDDIPYGNSDIWAYDLSTGHESAVCTDTGNQRDPQIDGDNVIWLDYSKVTPANYQALSIFPCDIRGIDLRTGQRFNVTDDGQANGEAQISNGWVVYTSYRLGSYKDVVKAYEISTGRTIQLTPKLGTYNEPQIGRNGLAAWDVQTGEDMNIQGCSVYDRKLIAFTSGKGYHGGPALGNNMLVYQDNDKPGGYQWVGYDLSAGVRFGVATTLDWVDRYMPLDDGSIAWVEDDFSRLHRKGMWPDGATFTLKTAQPVVIGTFSAPDPYASSVAQSQADFPDGAETVVVANGSIWDDVAVGAGLAGDGSPLLLTGKDALPAGVAAELTRLAPKRVQVVGGTGSVSDEVLAQIAAAVATDTVVERTGGSGPADTALCALESAAARAAEPASLGSSSGFGGTVVVVSGRDKVTSGLVVPVLRGRGIPVVFAGKALSARDLSRMRAAGVTRAVVVGGTKGVSAYSAKQLGWLVGKRNVVRINGKNAYQTSTRFDEYAIRHLGMKLDGVGIAANVASTDVLMAGLKNGRAHGLLLFTGTAKLASSVADELKARRYSIHRATYVGRGKRLVTKPVRRAVRLIVH